MTITEFLLARITEDEAWANAAIATPGATHWHWVSGDTDAPVAPDPFTQEYLEADGSLTLRTVEELTPVSWEGGSPLPDFLLYAEEALSGAAGHIIRHDPARVLAECEAKRRIVALHQPSEGWNYRGTDCCSRCTADGEYPALDGIDDPDQDLDAQNWPCPTLRALAAVYADHPDYDESWRP